MATSITSGTSDPPAAADRLRQEMRTIRRELGDEVEELVGHAEQLMDWRYYLRRYPWASLGVAALVGYFVVPGRTVTLPTDEHTLGQLAERLSLQKPAAPAKKSSLLGSLVSMGAGWAARAALAYATQQVSKILTAQPAMHQPVEAQHD